MWTTFVLAAVLGLTAHQTEQLTVSNVRALYGYLGPERHDDKLLPGDSYYLAFDVEGMKVDPDGKVIYSMSMEVTNSKGKVVYGRDPRDLEIYNSFGGSRIQVFAFVQGDPNQPVDEYTIKVTVADRATKASQSVKRRFQVVEKTFGLVRLTTSYDPEGRIPAPSVGVTGQQLWVNFFAVGFERDPAKKQPNVAVQMRALDETGKPTLDKPFSGEITKLEEDRIAVPLSFVVSLNRPGKFTVELLATDRITKKTAKMSFPVTVVEQKATDTTEQK